MTNYKNEINVLKKEFNEKELEKLQIKQLLDLIEKLEDQHIEDSTLNFELEKLMNNLRSVKSNVASGKKNYNKSYYKIKQLIQKDFGIIEKGTYSKMGLGIGMTLGVCVGAVFASSMSNGVAIGMVLGMAIGAAVGNLKDKQTAEAGKTY